MTRVFQIGPAPLEEACAQLGCTPDFEDCNRLELTVYRAALIAKHGLPPEGVEIAARANRHDFGTYRELVAVIDARAQERPEAIAYVEAVQEGLRSWISAGFTAPITYNARAAPSDERRTAEDIVASAMMITRPAPGGTFFPSENETLHRNLLEAFPQWIPALLREGAHLKSAAVAHTERGPARDPQIVASSGS
ncbi:hypothetical protein [Novosphingobium gossypii]|uniref:hypothetical protein n=1 Tax=Novosphingobium gossypii TaxID=1604774 RepID=UPI003D20B5D4